VVATDGLVVQLADRRVTLSFVQHFRTSSYADFGHKELVVVDGPGGARIVSERMLDSRLGWDDDDNRRRFPAHGATCEVAFDPSRGRQLVALGRFDAYRDALRAAGKARRRGTSVELVWGDDFEGLERGYWLLSGATDDAAEARAVAARTHGRVWAVRAATPHFPRVLRFGEERQIATTPALLTTIGDAVYYVTTTEAVAMHLDGDGLAETFRVPLPGEITPIRVAARDGHAYLLDSAGHWSLLAAAGVTQTRSFDPEPEGRVAVFGPHRFEIEGNALAYRRNEGEAHRLPLEAGATGVWRLGVDRLLLFRRGQMESNLFLFRVGDAEPILTKVCGTIEGGLVAPAHVTMGDLDVDTDGEGGFELWSSQRGFFSATLEGEAQCGPPSEDCTTAQQSEIDSDNALLGQPVLQLHGQVACECFGC